MDAATDKSLEIAKRWCASKGEGWFVRGRLGKGGTAPVFEIAAPDGIRALKIYDEEFSSGEKGQIERRRIDQQLALKDHDCPYLVQVFEGGQFEGRFFLLMSRAQGQELEKRLPEIPRNKIRGIVDNVTRAALFLKSKKLCHRDIKSANVFVTDDFSHATLLDISVIRDIYDPIGLGTDSGGQLPVLATARYSPPEYLFRLLQKGPDLWHALTVYQLGALLYDLIMREPLFQAEYVKSVTNRYRFAWVVATMMPMIEAVDVDSDLRFLALRALDKDWKRRSRLRMEDFLADPTAEQNHALQMLGISTDRSPFRSREDLVIRIKRVREVAKVLEEAVRKHLGSRGVKAFHSTKLAGDDSSRLVTFKWNTAMPLAPENSSLVQLDVTLALETGIAGSDFRVSVRLSQSTSELPKEASLELPSVKDVPDCESRIVDQVIGAFSSLAVDLTRA